jgi:hypothetical protein
MKGKKMNKIYKLAVHFDNGSEAHEYYDENGNVFIEGRKNSNFVIVFTNLTAYRVKAVMSVDGLNTLTGEPCKANSTGYVVEPNGVLTVPGWQINSKEVARFTFSDKSKSYAALKETQNTENCGVIGCSVFEELPAAVPFAMSFGGTSNCSVTNQAACSSYIELDAGLGTSFGEAQDHSVQYVATKFLPRAAHTMSIFYDSRKNLIARGIIKPSRQFAPKLPNPFPGDFCKPPTGWTC